MKDRNFTKDKIRTISITALITAVLTSFVVYTSTNSKNTSTEVVNGSETQATTEQPKEQESTKTDVVETIAALIPARNEADKIAKANAEEEWGDDYRMVKYTYENQMEAYDWLATQTEHTDIMKGAVSEWESDYRMVKYTYENQVKAFNSLQE